MKTVVLGLAALSLIACTRSNPVDQKSTAITESTPPPAKTSMDDQDKAGTTTLTSAAWLGNDTAMDRIAVSRCAREAACAEVGPNAAAAKHDRQACVAEMRTRTWSSLRADVCPSGIKGDPLDECIQAIQHESCDSPLESLSRLTQCRASALCGK